MERTPLPTEEILGFISARAERNRDLPLIDRVTVARGYLELVHLDPNNGSYRHKLDQALTDLHTVYPFAS